MNETKKIVLRNHAVSDQAKNDTAATESALDDLLCSFRARWFWKHGATTHYAKGFISKEIASIWIDSHEDLNWRSGFIYRLYGDKQDRMIVDRKGNLART